MLFLSLDILAILVKDNPLHRSVCGADGSEVLYQTPFLMSWR